MIKKILILICICLCSKLVQAQSIRIKSITRSNGEWSSQLVLNDSWTSVSLWEHFSENQHHFTAAAKAPLFYFGPFLKNGLLSEVYHPLNNSASSRWFREIMGFSSDLSFAPGSGQLLFLGESTGGYIINKAEKPLVSGIIINNPVDSSIKFDLHFSQSQRQMNTEDDWYYIQKPFWGRELYHPALGFHYNNSIFRLNAFILAALSSLGERAYCESVQMNLKLKTFSISLYAGKKDASFINPFGEKNQRAFESSGLFQWKPSPPLELKQSINYQIDWPEKSQTSFYSAKTRSESQIQWLIHDQKKDQLILSGNFQWTRDLVDQQNLQDCLKSHLLSQFSYQGFSLNISVGLIINSNNSWQINNSLGYENDFFKAKLSQNWTITQTTAFEYNASFSWKNQRHRLFLELKSRKPLDWEKPQENKSGFLEQNTLSLGWESHIDTTDQLK